MHLTKEETQIPIACHFFAPAAYDSPGFGVDVLSMWLLLCNTASLQCVHEPPGCRTSTAYETVRLS